MPGTIVLRPQYPDMNVGTWVGFWPLVSLAEDAVLEWFRDRGYGPATLYQDYGLRLCVIDSSVMILGPAGADDEMTAEVEQVGARFLSVRLDSRRDGASSVVLRGRLTAVLVREPAAAEPVPQDLAGLVVDDITGLGTAVGSHDPRYEEQALAAAAAQGPNGFRQSWRIPYSACQYSGQMKLSGYVRALEQITDEFLAVKGLRVSQVLAERGWIPAVSKARIRLLADACLDETIHADYEIAQVVKGTMFDGRLECHVRRGDRVVPTATAMVMHGYARADGPEAGRFVALDEAAIAAVAG